MDKKRIIRYATILTFIVASVCSKISFAPYPRARGTITYAHTASSYQKDRLKNKHPLKSVVRIKTRYIGADYSFVLQHSNIKNITSNVSERPVFTPCVSFVYKYSKKPTQLRGPPTA